MGLFKLVGQLMAGEDVDWSDWQKDPVVSDARPAPPVLPPSPASQSHRVLVLHTYFGEMETVH